MFLEREPHVLLHLLQAVVVRVDEVKGQRAGQRATASTRGHAEEPAANGEKIPSHNTERSPQSRHVLLTATHRDKNERLEMGKETKTASYRDTTSSAENQTWLAADLSEVETAQRWDRSTDLQPQNCMFSKSMIFEKESKGQKHEASLDQPASVKPELELQEWL